VLFPLRWGGGVGGPGREKQIFKNPSEEAMEGPPNSKLQRTLPGEGWEGEEADFSWFSDCRAEEP
jgi:hypothetical protein